MSVRRRASGRAHYNYFRDYDPAIGGYIESDPIGLKGGINPYRYVAGNPATKIDRRGLQPASSEERADQINVVGLIKAGLAFGAMQDAESQTFDSQLPGLHNGPADAFRHCVWSCIMTQLFGAKNAALVGAVHELNNLRANPPEPAEELQMDTANNTAGRECGSAPPQADHPCSDRCMNRLKAGRLFGLGGNPMRFP